MIVHKGRAMATFTSHLWLQLLSRLSGYKRCSLNKIVRTLLNLSSSEAKVAAESKEENNYELCLVSTQDRSHWPVGTAKLTLVY